MRECPASLIPAGVATSRAMSLSLLQTPVSSFLDSGRRCDSLDPLQPLGLGDVSSFLDSGRRCDVLPTVRPTLLGVVSSFLDSGRRCDALLQFGSQFTAACPASLIPAGVATSLDEDRIHGAAQVSSFLDSGRRCDSRPRISLAGHKLRPDNREVQPTGPSKDALGPSRLAQVLDTSSFAQIESLLAVLLHGRAGTSHAFPKSKDR